MKKGKVWLVGAGPGDPGLLTVRGRELIDDAEVHEVMRHELLGLEVAALHRQLRALAHRGQQRVHQRMCFGRMVGAEVAHIHIQRHRALLRPGVYTQVSLP